MAVLRRSSKSAALAAALSLYSGALVVHVENQHNSSGTIRVCVFTSATGFPDDPSSAFACQVKKASDALEFEFEGVPFGRTAVSAYHDMNNNGRLDKGWLGIPKEPVGVSQGEAIGPRRPRFESSAFTFERDPAEVRVRLRLGR